MWFSTESRRGAWYIGSILKRRGIYSAEYFQNKARAKLEQAFPAPQYKVELDILLESSKPMIGMPGIMLDLMQQKLKSYAFTT